MRHLMKSVRKVHITQAKTFTEHVKANIPINSQNDDQDTSICIGKAACVH